MAKTPKTDEVKLEDFGEKIGGARKDLYTFRDNGGFTPQDVAHWSPLEREKHIVKKELFPKLDFQKMVDDGKLDRLTAYWLKRAIDTLPAKPDYANIPRQKYDDIHNSRNAPLKTPEEMKADIFALQDRWIDTMNIIKEELLKVKSMDGVSTFRDNIARKRINGELKMEDLGSKGRYLCGQYLAFEKKAFVTSDYAISKLAQEMNEKGFLMNDDQKILRDYQIRQYDGSNVSISTDYHSRQCLQLNAGGSRYFFHREKPETMDMSAWKKDTYFVVAENTKYTNGQRVIGMNFPTREEAVAFALEHGKECKEKELATSNQRGSKKGRFLPQQLDHCYRVGEDVRDGQAVNGNDMLRDFAFRGGEFGNWENQNDRQTNMNMAYEAFSDLAKALKIANEDISLRADANDAQPLAIAFGSRGKGGALAHFEPDANVINLTKMRGAGSLAHEWGHALDYLIAKANGRVEAMESEVPFEQYDPSKREHISNDNMLRNIIETMKYLPPDPENPRRARETEFYKNAKAIDDVHSKTDRGYWQSDVEMFARAFACYVMDKLSPDKCDYLCGHAEMKTLAKDAKTVLYAYPRGEERERINEAFDKLIEQLKEKGLLHERPEGKEHKLIRQCDGMLEEETEQTKATVSQKENVEQSTAPSPALAQETSEVEFGEQLSFDFEGLQITFEDALKEQAEAEKEEVVYTAEKEDYDEGSPTIQERLEALTEDEKEAFVQTCEIDIDFGFNELTDEDYELYKAILQERHEKTPEGRFEKMTDRQKLGFISGVEHSMEYAAMHGVPDGVSADDRKLYDLICKEMEEKGMYKTEEHSYSAPETLEEEEIPESKKGIIVEATEEDLETSAPAGVIPRETAEQNDVSVSAVLDLEAYRLKTLLEEYGDTFSPEAVAALQKAMETIQSTADASKQETVEATRKTAEHTTTVDMHEVTLTTDSVIERLELDTYLLNVTGRDFFEFANRAVDFDAELKSYVEENGGVTNALLSGEEKAVIYAVVNNTNADLRLSIGEIDTSVPITSAESRQFAETLDIFDKANEIASQVHIDKDKIDKKLDAILKDE